MSTVPRDIVKNVSQSFVFRKYFSVVLVGHLCWEPFAMANYPISHFTDLGIPVLCIHDSFVIDYRCGAALKKVMRRASSQSVGEELDLSHNYLGLGEVPESRREDYKELRRLDRAPGYLERKRWFEERKYDGRQKVELG